MSNCFPCSAHLFQSDSQVVVALGVLRLDPQSLFAVGNRLRQFALTDKSNAQSVVRVSMVGLVIVIAL